MGGAYINFATGMICAATLADTTSYALDDWFYFLCPHWEIMDITIRYQREPARYHIRVDGKRENGSYAVTTDVNSFTIPVPERHQLAAIGNWVGLTLHNDKDYTDPVLGSVTYKKGFL